MTRVSDQKISLQGRHRGESAKAVLFEVCSISGSPADSIKKEWFPFSQTDKIVRAPAGSDQLDELVVSRWILQQKGYDV